MRSLKIKAKLLKEGTVRHGEVTEEEIAHAELQCMVVKCSEESEVLSELQSFRTRVWSL